MTSGETMQEEYREWGVRSRRTVGNGEMVLPARDEQDAEHTVELIRPSEDKIIEVVSRGVGPWESQEEREDRVEEEGAAHVVYLPEILILGHLAGEGIQSIDHLGAFRTLLGALRAFEERKIVRPDVKLAACFQEDEIDPRYVVKPVSFSFADQGVQEFHSSMGMVMQIRVEEVQS